MALFTSAAKAPEVRIEVARLEGLVKTAQNNYDALTDAGKKTSVGVVMFGHLNDAQTTLSNYMKDRSGWDTSSTDGYLGTFVAANQINSGGKISWADISATDDIKEINIATLNPETILAKAQSLDQDIDGKSGAGSSSVKEGEERFIFGASYTGTQGVSISEISGIFASITHGKRVTWTDGDVFAKTKGQDYIVDIDANVIAFTTNSDSLTFERNVKGTMSSSVKANKFETETTSHTNISTTFANYIQNASACTLRTTQAISGVSQTTNLAVYLNVMNFSPVSHVLNCAAYSYAVNVGSSRFSLDFTRITAQISKGLFFNVAANSLDTFQAAASKIGVDINSTDLKISEKKANIEKIHDQIKSVTNFFNQGEVVVEKNKVNIENNEFDWSGCDLSIEELDLSLEDGKVYISNFGSIIHR